MQAAKPTSKPSSLIPYHATSTANFALQPQPGSQTVTHARDHFPRKTNTHEKNAKCKRPLPLRTNTSKKNAKCKRPLITRKQNVPKKNAKSKRPLHLRTNTSKKNARCERPSLPIKENPKENAKCKSSMILNKQQQQQTSSSSPPPPPSTDLSFNMRNGRDNFPLKTHIPKKHTQCKRPMTHNNNNNNNRHRHHLLLIVLSAKFL